MKRLLFLRGKLKGLFFLSRGHWFFSSHIFSFIGSMSALSKWIQQHKQLGYNDFYSFKFDYQRREDLFNYVIERENLDAPIDYLEFGVSKGDSFRWWTNRIKNPAARFYGFDTFTGLPEDWGPLCDAIEAVTEGADGRDFSHCALVIRDEDSLKVIEAIGTQVQVTSLKMFLQRSKKVIVSRLKTEDASLISRAVTYAKSLEGKPYDEVFL